MKKSLIVLILFPILTWGNEFSENELLLQLASGDNPREALEIIGAKSFESLELLDRDARDFFNKPLVASFDNSMDIQKRLKILLKNPLIKTAQLNYKYTIQGELTPNDPLLKNQWEHKNLQIQKVWNETTNCGQKVVAVLDTGVNFSHSDLKESEFPKAFNAINPKEIPIDYNGHGTLMASIIGAKGDNSIGVSGVCWTTKIMAVKVLNDLGEGFSSEIIKGINFARKNKASILNLSFGSYSGEDFFLRNSLEKTLSQEIIAIVPAGNKGLDMDKISFWPCSFKLKGMLCVGSTTMNGKLADFSNYGDRNVDLAAPGDNIFGIGTGSFKETRDDFNEGWRVSEDSKVSEKENCVADGRKTLMIPQDNCGTDGIEKGIQWGKKDFGPLVLNFDFSYVQFLAKANGKIKFLINGEYIEDLFSEQSEYFFDLSSCKDKNDCVLEFLTGNTNSKVTIWDFKIWGLKLGSNTYQLKYGSSLSAAYVSGLAALIGSFNPKLSSEEIIDSLKKGSKKSKNLQGKIDGYRMVDPWGQLKFLSKPKWN